MATRDTYTSASPGTLTGDDLIDNLAAHLKELYDAAAFPLTSVGGTADAVTATLDPVLDGSGLVDGMRFGITWGAANTGGMTLAINGGSPIAILDAEGSALVAGAVASGLRSLVEYVGGDFRVLTPLLAAAAAGSSAYALTITASQTWNKPAGIDDDQIIWVEMWGGGGSGRRTTSDNNSSGGGGGSYILAAFRAGDVPSSVSVSIGAGGASVTSNGNGVAGGATSFGALLSAPGGSGGTTSGGAGGAKGSASTAARAVRVQQGGNGGGPATAGAGADNSGGGGGGVGVSGAAGGDSLFGGDGGAGGAGSGVPGVAGSSPGGGGGGNGFGGSASSSGAGARGEVRIWI